MNYIKLDGVIEPIPKNAAVSVEVRTMGIFLKKVFVLAVKTIIIFRIQQVYLHLTCPSLILKNPFVCRNFELVRRTLRRQWGGSTTVMTATSKCEAVPPAGCVQEACAMDSPECNAADPYETTTVLSATPS